MRGECSAELSEGTGLTYLPTQVEGPVEIGGLPHASQLRVRELEREVANLRATIWGFFQMMDERPAQAILLLRSALPDDYKPVGA